MKDLKGKADGAVVKEAVDSLFYISHAHRKSFDPPGRTSPNFNLRSNLFRAYFWRRDFCNFYRNFSASWRLSFWTSLVFILLGSLSKTFIGYAFGEFLYKKFNHHNVLSICKKGYMVFCLDLKKAFWSIFISKFIMGANYIVIIFSGYEKVDYRKYLKAEISSIIIWAPLLLSLGYFFSLYRAPHQPGDFGNFRW